jgi:hypothetical protein
LVESSGQIECQIVEAGKMTGRSAEGWRFTKRAIRSFQKCLKRAEYAAARPCNDTARSECPSGRSDSARVWLRMAASRCSGKPLTSQMQGQMCMKNTLNGSQDGVKGLLSKIQGL